jgi:hypothetical protein
MLQGSAGDGTNSVSYSSGGAVDAVSPVTGWEVKSAVVCSRIAAILGL